ERNPLDVEAYHQRAHVHERLGHWKDAIDDHSQAIQRAPHCLALQVCRARAYLRMGEEDQAAADLRKADALTPNEANNLAWELATAPNLRQREPGLAVQLAKQAVRQVPGETAYWNTLGVAHYRAGEWQAAIQALEEAENLAPSQDFGFN